MSLKQLLNDAKDNNTYLHLKSYYPDVHTWKDGILNINWAFNNSSIDDLPSKISIFKNDGSTAAVVNNGKLDIFSFNSIQYKSRFRYRHGNTLPKAEQIINDINNCFDNYKVYNTKVHLNIVSEGENYNIHEDDHDVLSWQCEGSVIYKIYENNSCTEIVLNPGDIFYMPSGIKHSVFTYKPRMTIIFQIHSLSKDMDW